MATLGLRGNHRLGGFRLKGDCLKATAIIATVLVVPAVASVTLLSLQQVVPRQSYLANGSDCSVFTRLAFKPDAPSPRFVPNGDRCEVADYDLFVAAAKSYNRRRGLLVGFISLATVAALIGAILRARW